MNENTSNNNNNNKRKRIGNFNTHSENIQSGYRDRIWHCKMRHANNEKWETTQDEQNGTTKSRKIRTLCEKESSTWEY